MKWAPAMWLGLALVLSSGCRQGPVAGLDPFGRTTIPPPATGSIGQMHGPVAIDPYYSGPRATSQALLPLDQRTSSTLAPSSNSSIGTAGGSSAQWMASGASGGSQRLRPVSTSFLNGSHDGQISLASGAVSNTGGVATVGHEPRVNGNLSWSQPGSIGTAPATTVGSGTSRIDLATLPQPGRFVAQSSSSHPAQKLAPSIASSASSQYGYAADYSWLKGRLEYSASQRQWKLRYIPIDGQTDDYGGSIVMPSSPALSSFRDGDFVRVQGQLVGRDPNTVEFSASYRVQRISALK